MTYIIGDIEFNLVEPVNKSWFSKFKKMLLKNDTEYIETVLLDAKHNRDHAYSNKYYACAKFIKHTTKLQFTKKSNKLYYILTYNDDFRDTFTVEHKGELVCSRVNRLKTDDGLGERHGGRTIGRCKNNCCKFVSKMTRKFNIQW